MDGTRLFQVKGTSTLNTRAVQVEEMASALNTNDCFVLETPTETYIWYGKVSTDGDGHFVVHGNTLVFDVFGLGQS